MTATKNADAEMITVSSLDQIGAIQGRQEIENRQQFAKLVVDLADGKERHQSEILGILHWNGCTVDSLKEKIVQVNERRAKLKEIEDLQASQSGLPAAREALAAFEAKFKAAETEYRENIYRLQGNVNQLQSVPTQVIRLRRELQQTAGEQELRALQTADRQLDSLREKLNDSKILAVNEDAGLKGMRNLLAECIEEANETRIEENTRRVTHFEKQANAAHAVVASLEADILKAIQARTDALNACLIASSV